MSKEKEGDSFDNTKEKGHRIQPIYHIPLGFGISADKNCADTFYGCAAGISSQLHCRKLHAVHREISRNGTAEEKAYSVIPACGGAWVCDLYGGNEYRFADIAFRNVQPSPIMTAIIASKVYREKIGPVSWISIFIAFSGVMILLLWDSHGTFSIDAAMLWMLLSAASWAGYNIMTRKLVAMGYTSAQITCFSMLGAALWLCFSAMQGFREMVTGEPKHFLALLYLAIISNAIGCILWAKALAYAEKTSEVANFMFLSPLLSTLMSFLLLHEVPGMGTFVGGAIIICGLLLFNLKGQKKE